MEQTLYTTEGTKYILRTLNTNSILPNTGAAPSVFPFIAINNTNPIFGNAGGMSYFTTKPFVPLSYGFSAFDTVNQIVAADFHSLYYSVISGAGIESKYRNILSKSIPYIQRNYYTDALNNNFMFQYNQLLLSDEDFMQALPQTEIFFFPSIAEAMTSNYVGGVYGSLPIGTYSVTTSFLFYELNP